MICIKCNIDKNSSEFELSSKTTFRKKCKVCRRIEAKNNYYANAEKKKEYAKKYRENHKAYYNKYNKDYYLSNMEKEKARKKLEYNNNKEYYHNKYIERMKDPIKKANDRKVNSEYRVNNKDKRSSLNCRWMKEQIAKNSNYAISSRLRTMIRAYIRKKGAVKSNASIYYLGCTYSEIIKILNLQGYDPNKHDIDHIIPLNNFDMLNEDHKIIAFNYLNLQPLEKSLNRSKQDMLPNGWEFHLIKICDKLNINHAEIYNYIKAKERRA